ncbi:uncharacterized protein LOC101157957 isoform X1 [Oryzias latipes]|uniref:uncharacterized protein LOC101157957 isoform X1 n=1 Tax=Oryzias latipes TaxID=8090 RepID=UPI000CE20150|nr:uncharacterized protein LOC101157957 isoform X1 [Oryzias latipes]
MAAKSGGSWSEVCCSKFTTVTLFKKHLFSFEHKKEMGALFQQTPFQSSGTLPCIAFVDPNLKHKMTKPVVGLSMLTLCFSTLRHSSFYLCHICEKVCSLNKILDHIFSDKHYSNYSSNTNPDDQNLSWIPNMDMKEFLFPKLKQADTTSVLQILDLPKELFEKLLFKPYSEVMATLSENLKLYNMLKDFQPRRTDILANQNDGNRKQPLVESQTASAKSPSLKNVKCKLRCQTCSDVFLMKQFLGHLSNGKHMKMLTKYFGKAQRGFGFCQKAKVYLALFTYVCDRLKRNQPTVGTSLVVTCICSQVEAEPFSLCFACQESFLQSHLSIHFESKRHLINTLLYLNPWRLPFGWQDSLDESPLRLMAREEEGEGTDVILKVFDLSYEMFCKLIPTDYRHVMNRLQVYHMPLKCEVPKKQTFSKLQQNEKFPLLGMQFLVVYNALSSDWESVQKNPLCLLCKRKLTQNEYPVHVFSWEHVMLFLNAFHPGSLNSSTVDAETLLDLAKQAGSVHHLSCVQEICLDRPIIEPCSYQKATQILASAKRKEGKGSLEPLISARMKLVPRNTQKVFDQSTVRNDKDTVEPGAVQIKKEKVEGNKEQLETDPQMSIKMCPKTEKADNQTVKVKTEVPSTDEPSKEGGESHKSSDGNDGGQIKTEESQRNKRLSNTEEKKRKSQFSGPSQGENRHEDLRGETSSKRPRLTTNIDGEVSTVMPECELKKEKTIDGDLNKVSSKLVECRCGTHKPIYLCGRCQLRVSERDIFNHMNGFDHQEMVQEVFYTDEKIFGDLSKQSFQSALETLLGLGLDYSNPPITSDPLCIEGSPYPQTSTQNNVVIEIDSAEDCDEATVSMGTQTISRTNEAQMECGEDASDLNTHSSASTVSVFTRSNSPINGSQTTTTEPDRASSKPKMTPTKLPPASSAAAISKTSSKFATATSPLERSASASKGGAFPLKVAHSPHADSSGREVTCKKSSPSNTAVKQSVMDQNKVSSKIPATSEKHRKPDPCVRTAHRTKSVEENADSVPNADERSHPNSGLSARSRHKNLHKEPLTLSPSKTSASGNQVKVGTNHLIVVSWDGKQQVYCMLCSVKLNLSGSHHLVSINHQYNYVKRKYPEWTAKHSELESKLNHTVALLAKIERDLPHSRSVQKLKVTEEVYQDLGCLPDNKAVEKVKAMVRKKDPADAASSSVCNADEVSDPCEVSSSDDVQAPQSETTGASDHDAPDLNSGSLHQLEDDQIAGKTVDREIEFQAGIFSRCQSSDEIHSNVILNQSDPETIPSPVQAEDATETSQLAELEQDAEVLPQIAPTPTVRSYGLFVEAPKVNIHETKKLTVDQVFTPKLQPVKEQRQQEQGPFAGATGKEALSKSLFVGGKACTSSNLPSYLKAGLHNSAAVIGKSCIWECQGIGLRTLFLCDCCKEKVPLRDICHHMISPDHQLRYLEREYPEYLQKFWFDEELLPKMKLDILKAVVLKLSNQEHEQRVDAQCVCLVPELHKFICNASFSEALKIVQNKEEVNRGFIQLPISVAEQEKAALKTKASYFGKTKMSQDAKAIEDGGFSSLSSSTPAVFKMPNISSAKVGGMEVDCSPLNLDPVVHNDGSPHVPQKLSGGPHPKPTPAESRLKMFDSLNVKEEEGFLTSASSPVAPTVSQSRDESVRDKNSSSRKRPADTSVNTLLTTFSQHEDSMQAAAELKPMKAKAEACSPPASKAIFAHSAPGLTSDSPKDKNLSVSPKSPKRNLEVLEKLISVLKKSSSKTVTDGQSANSISQEPKHEPVPDSKPEQRRAHTLVDRLLKDPSDDLDCNNHPDANYENNSSSVGNTLTLPVQDGCSVSQPPSDSTTNLNPGQIPESSGKPDIKSTAGCHSLIKTIITARQKAAHPVYQKLCRGKASRDHQSSVHTEVHCGAVAAPQSHAAQSQITNVTDESSLTFQTAASHAAANNQQKRGESLSHPLSSVNPANTAELVNRPLLLSTAQSFSTLAFSEGDVKEQLQLQSPKVLQQQQVNLQQHQLQQSLQQYQQMSQHQIMQQYQQQLLQKRVSQQYTFQQYQHLVPQQQISQQYQQHMQQQEKQFQLQQQMQQQQVPQQQISQQYQQHMQQQEEQFQLQQQQVPQQQLLLQYLFQQQQSCLWTGSWQSGQ